MPNTWFKFRQFTIHQDRCAMKVCTDSCILGAWMASRLRTCQNILDIGAGTGLLSLMLAQQHHAVIDAIELDQEAAGQAAENFAASPWSDRIHLIHQDVRHYTFLHGYDFIISNPPFFEDDLLSPSSGKNKAKHAETLNLEALVTIISRTLNTHGAFGMLVPLPRSAYAEKLAAGKGYFLQEKMLIRQTPAHAPFRSILLFSGKESGLTVEQELTIRDEQGKETPELLDLMKDYYLR
ncbi:MAG: methyltransferase [Bacteroidota bacterium]|nr:methyltransferase [Bacteroidota bacterium]MDP4249516.1 methyltransferase [Bacteroidota bacterium]